jgi:dienelactone hydrolase
VSFHGGLDRPPGAETKPIKARVLVCHGADDPYVPAKDIAALHEEMRQAGADWQMIYYGGAVHSFTSPEAGCDVSRGAAYNPVADVRSWEHMKSFLGEVLR